MYTVRCIFCCREHASEYWDQIELEIMRCRDEAPAFKRGDMATFEEDPKIRPISCETTAYADGYV